MANKPMRIQLSRRKCIYWGTVNCESGDFPGLWLRAKIRPRWYWSWRRLCVLGAILWRRFDPACTPMDAATAWAVSSVAVGLIGPMWANEGTATP